MDISVHRSIAAIREICVVTHFVFDHVSGAETELILQSLDPNNSAVARGGARGARAPPVFFLKSKNRPV